MDEEHIPQLDMLVKNHFHAIHMLKENPDLSAKYHSSIIPLVQLDKLILEHTTAIKNGGTGSGSSRAGSARAGSAHTRANSAKSK